MYFHFRVEPRGQGFRWFLAFSFVVFSWVAVQRLVPASLKTTIGLILSNCIVVSSRWRSLKRRTYSGLVVAVFSACLVVGWGNPTTHGSLLIPLGLQDVSAIASGDQFCLAQGANTPPQTSAIKVSVAVDSGSAVSPFFVDPNADPMQIRVMAHGVTLVANDGEFDSRESLFAVNVVPVPEIEPGSVTFPPRGGIAIRLFPGNLPV